MADATSTELPEFQRYQLAFTARLRDPQNNLPPAGVPDDRMAVYEEIVFNNLFESVSACFPVARKVLGKHVWLKLTQAFMREYSANDPLFRKIPEQFLQFLDQTSSDLQAQIPPYIKSLCHYEWIELLVASAPYTAKPANIDTDGDFVRSIPVFVPSMQLLDYDYAVHKISPSHKPNQEESTQLLVYLNADDEVKFIELNAVTYRLISLLHSSGYTGSEALMQLAMELQHPEPARMIDFGLAILKDLKGQGVIIGTRD